MELTSVQKDTLTELINIGYARAAGALSDLTGHRITLAVPEVAIHEIEKITPLLHEVIQGEITSVNQFFGGSISGNAILLLDKAAALLLNRLLTDRPQAGVLDESAREVIVEVGNIVLNACLGVFGNLLQVQISFSVPHLEVDDIEHIMRSIRIQDQSFRYALMIHTRFHLRASDVSGYLVIILGVTSLDRLILELRKWEEREVG
ncbi:MAG TPA: chemotaxis protein CheC [Verrucomicrobiae bacterium]|jgi:chemotaxis protein CheC|nr:chemotaxis protein CheC [Verrucomicrobiae bacterium]